MKKNILLFFSLLSFFFLFFSLRFVTGSLTFTEIMYNPFGNEANREWIELFNYGNETLNISAWKLKDGTTIRSINLYNNLTGTYLIEPYSFVILARNPENFSLEYNYSGNLFQTSFTLTNTGKELILYDSNNNLVDSVFYANLADEGYTLELKDISLDNYLIENWQQSNPNPGKLPFNILNSTDLDNNDNNENNDNNDTLDNKFNNTDTLDNNFTQQDEDHEEQNHTQVPEFSTFGMVLALTFVIAMFFKTRK